MPDVFMPRLSDTMQEGTVSTWIKQVGDTVEKGDVLAEIETDKATMELEAYDAGVLEKIVVESGQTVPIGEVIAVIGDGSGTSAGQQQAAPAGSTTKAATAKATPTATAEATPTDTPPPVSSPAAPPVVAAGDRDVKASPLARAIAKDAGLDLATVRGSGPGGRIVRADVEAAVEAAREAPAGAPSDRTPAVHAGPDVEEVPLNNIRRVTARRLATSMQQAPHFFVTRVVAADELVACRARVNAGLAELAAGDETPTKISINDLVVKAVAAALRAHPDVNVSYVDDKLLRYRRIHIGIAVALDDGLIVPVIRDADTLTVSQIADQSRDLAERARNRRLTPEEITGSTFSVSNLGMFGVDEFTAVINPPEAAILAVGAAKEEPVVRDGAVVVGHTMRITLSVDHRAVDGATAAKFAADLVTLLENPFAALA
jgi:pyruvate dehydrogenase E2 component (dihydrolipoamide acetyltransferase)